MRDFTELDNFESLDLLADLLEPMTEILGDPEIRKAYEEKSTKLVTIVSMMIRRHKPEVIRIMALIDGIPENEYKVNVFTLPINVIQLLNNKNVREMFPFANQKKETESSGSVMENTEESEK